MSVEVEVKSQLLKLVEDLQKIQESATKLTKSLKDQTETVGEAVETQTRKQRTMMDQLVSMGRRTADRLRQDFAALASVTSLAGGLALNKQFAGSVKEAVDLSDTVRRLGSIFGVAKSDFASFQSRLQSGLGKIGLSGEAAANALKGLAETPVRGQDNILAYASQAGQLASIGGQKGSEGEIAKGTAGIIRARGGNVNDIGQLNSVSKEILQIRQATGKSITDITTALQDIYAKTNKDFQGNLKNGGSTSLASAALLGGPQATGFIEKYLGMDRISRKGLEAQGFKSIVGGNGQLNTNAITKTLAEAKSRGLGDAQAGLKTFGFSDDEAQGFIRLADAVKTNADVINGARTKMVDLNEEYRKSMGLGDSFKASINKIKGVFSPALSAATQGATNILGSASGSMAGAGAVVGGSAVLAAMLTGGGLRGIGSMLGGEAKAKAIEAATGEKVQRVEVINWPATIGLGGAAGAVSGMGGLAGTLGKAGLVGAAGAAGLGLGTLASAGVDKAVSSNFLGAGTLDKKIQAVFDVMYQKLTGFHPVESRVKVDLNKKELKAATLPGRGAHQ